MNAQKLCLLLIIVPLSYTPHLNAENMAWEKALLATLYDYLEKDNADGLVKLITKDPSIINLQQQESKMTPLMLAAFLGKTKCMQALIDHKADLNVVDRNGKTALMHAVASANDKPVRLLLAHKPNVSIINHAGKTALEIAQCSAQQKRKIYDGVFDKIVQLLQQASTTQKTSTVQAPDAAQTVAIPQS